MESFYELNNEACEDGVPGVQKVAVHFDDDEAVPLVGFHGRENPAGGIKSIGFIWRDPDQPNCDAIDAQLGKEKLLTSDEAQALYNDIEKRYNKDFE